LYVTVPSIDDEIKRLVALKAKVVVGATEVPDMGQWALLTIPGGVTFGLWEEKDTTRAKPPTTREPHSENTVSFLEITSSDPPKTNDFLSKAFGWKFEHWAEGGDYWYCRGDSKTFSVGLRPKHQHVNANEVIAFVNVKDLDAALKKVTGKGRAKKVSDKLQMGPYGYYAYIEAPGAFKIGIWENLPHEEGKKEGEKETKEVKETAPKKAAPKKAAAAKKAAPAKKAAGKKKAPAKKAAPVGGRKRAASAAAEAPAAKKAKK
jgi:predicted enzyme related to lactoylglutathione lyase